MYSKVIQYTYVFGRSLETPLGAPLYYLGILVEISLVSAQAMGYPWRLPLRAWPLPVLTGNAPLDSTFVTADHLH